MDTYSTAILTPEPFPPYQLSGGGQVATINTAVAGQDGYHLTGGGYWGSFVREGVKRANGVAR